MWNKGCALRCDQSTRWVHDSSDEVISYQLSKNDVYMKFLAFCYDVWTYQTWYKWIWSVIWSWFVIVLKMLHKHNPNEDHIHTDIGHSNIWIRIIIFWIEINSLENKMIACVFKMHRVKLRYLSMLFYYNKVSHGLISRALPVLA